MGRVAAICLLLLVACKIRGAAKVSSAEHVRHFHKLWRDDAPGVAGRLYDFLAKTFSRRELFIDVDAIKPGIDFVKQLDSQVSQCDIMLALIGPQWLGLEDSTVAESFTATRTMFASRSFGAPTRHSGYPRADPRR